MIVKAYLSDEEKSKVINQLAGSDIKVQYAKEELIEKKIKGVKAKVKVLTPSLELISISAITGVVVRKINNVDTYSVTTIDGQHIYMPVEAKKPGRPKKND